jgi:hypothetical protein
MDAEEVAPELKVVDLLELLHELRRTHGRMLEREAEQVQPRLPGAVTDSVDGSPDGGRAVLEAWNPGSVAPLVVPQDRQADQQLEGGARARLDDQTAGSRHDVADALFEYGRTHSMVVER